MFFIPASERLVHTINRNENGLKPIHDGLQFIHSGFERSNRDVKNLELAVNRYRPVKKTLLINRIICSEFRWNRNIDSEAEALELDLDANYFAVAIIHIDAVDESTVYEFEADVSLLHDAVMNIVAEILREHYSSELCEGGKVVSTP